MRDDLDLEGVLQLIEESEQPHGMTIHREKTAVGPGYFDLGWAWDESEAVLPSVVTHYKADDLGRPYATGQSVFDPVEDE